ncbi:MoaD/ThiS family protein [Thermopirellula anaerolimosa]
MRVEVLLFGPYADKAGRRSVVMELSDPGDRTAGGVLRLLAMRHPELREMLAAAVLAVNHKAVPPTHPVRANDELAVIGLVSGG